MNISEKALTVFGRHLEDESRCLSDLAAVLDDEAAALRRMALEDLEALAHRKELLVSQHANLARERRAFLAHLADGGPPPSISALIEHAPANVRVTLTDIKNRLAELSEAVRTQNMRNQTFAQTGRELVNGLFQILGGLHAPRNSTYSARGRIRSHLLAHSTSRGSR
ncbi:MAG: flagellar protein FlgN [Myxococcota bacterium]|nr:flagellar protein FlgN [Myxococcota bacterium]